MTQFFSRGFMKEILVAAVLLTLSLTCFHRVFSQTERNDLLRGTVNDEAGSPIAKAEIEITTDTNRKFFCQTDDQGLFVCSVDVARGFSIVIEARGFSSLRQNFDSVQDFSRNSVFTLLPAALRGAVVVSANRSPGVLSETPASIVTVSKSEIERSAAPTIDDVLRQTAGFSLFRRTSSRNANPTTQGVSLRGVGASGASRSLILLDDVPLNDAFGGWVQWNRVAPIAVERVEVLRGGASSLYGSGALSGTINVISRRAADKVTFSAETFAGAQKTLSGAAFAGWSANGWSADASAANFQTRGYKIVDENVRGAADVFAGVRYANYSARFGKTFSPTANVFFRPAYFGEVRTNGTGLQTNRTHIRQFAVGGETGLFADRSPIKNSRFFALVYGGTQIYDQVFSVVATDRRTENLNRVQRVPAQTFGVSSRISGVYRRQTFLFGFDGREVRGASDETAFAGSRAASLFGAGGRERTLGFYVQDFARIGDRLIVVANLRFDRRRNYRAAAATLNLNTAQTAVNRFADRREQAFSPQLSALFQLTPRVSLYGSASKSFRAPTLNELYRGFRVGSVVTDPNENLRAETANNYEAGANFNASDFVLRGSIFLIDVNDPISNVTVSQTPNLITRRRQNAGRTRSRGVEIEAEKRLAAVTLRAGYLFADARVTEFPSNPDLVNKYIPQTARHQLTFQADYAAERWSFSLQGRASGRQFDDDLNVFELEPYFQLDGFASRRFGDKFQVFTGVENIFNSRYSTGRTPLRTIGSPINVRVGVRWN